MAASVALRLDLPMTLASPATFADGVREHQDEVYGVALRITGDRDAATDTRPVKISTSHVTDDLRDRSLSLRMTTE